MRAPLLLAVLLAACTEPNASAGGVTLEPLAAGDPACANGGVRIHAGDQAEAVCSGASGPAGASGETGPAGEVGAAGTSVQTEPLFVGDPNCFAGGSKLTSASGVSYVCNGLEGATGASGVSVATEVLAVGDARCPTGGVRLVAADGERVVCHGQLGPTGAEGPLGPTGPEGAPGQPGSDGSSVVVARLFPGDPHCVYGGAQFSGAGGPAYACHGGPAINGGLSAMIVVLSVPNQDPISFRELGGLGWYFDVTEVVDSRTGATLVRPGMLHVTDLVLRLPIGSSAALDAWRAAVVRGDATASKSSATLEIYGASGTLLAQFQLGGVWPAAQRTLSFSEDYDPTASDEVRFAVERLSRTGGEGNGTLDSGMIRLAFPGTTDVLYPSAIGGFGSRNDISEIQQTSPNGQIRLLKLVGKLHVEPISVRAPMTPSLLLWSWRDQVGSASATARRDFTVDRVDDTGAAGQRWQGTASWPRTYEVSTDALGRLSESFELVADSVSRVR